MSTLANDGRSARSTSVSGLLGGKPVHLQIAASFACVSIGYLITHGMVDLALAAVIAIPIGLFVLTRPERSLFLGIALTLLVPYSLWFGVPKASVMRIATLAAVVAVALGAHEVRARIRFAAVDFALIGFVLFGLLSWQFSPHPPGTLITALNYLTPLVFYGAARRFAHEADSIIWVLLVGAALASLTVYYEFLFTHQPLFVDKTAYFWNADAGTIFRPGGVFGSPPAASTILAMTSLCGLRLLATTTGMRRAVVWICMVISVGAMIMTFTRGPAIGFVLGLLVYVLLLKPRRWGRFVFGAAVVSVVLLFVVLPRISGASWYQEGVLRPGNLGIRELYWAQARPLIRNSREHLLIGHGINSLLIGSPDLPGPVDPDIAGAPLVRSPHSQYFRTLLEEGVVGLGLLLAWLLGAAAMGVRSAWGSAAERPLMAAGTAAILALLVAASVGDALRHPPTLTVAALITGLLVSCGQFARPSEVRKP
jgi:O-antigen ligase